MDTLFGLTRRPFRATPDPTAYVRIAAHQAASDSIQRAFRDGELAALVDGESGLGKTLLGLRFLESLPTNVQRVFVNVPRNCKPVELFQAILFDLGLPYEGRTEHELRLAVAGEVLAAAEREDRLGFFLDDAHHLTAESAEELRFLGQFETPTGPAAFVLLCGQPSLRSVLSAELSYSHRLAVRHRLLALSEQESEEYLHGQIASCGGRAEWIFSSDALSLLVKLGMGNPRTLNRLASNSLNLAEQDGADLVDAEAVLAAAELLELSPKHEVVREPQPRIVPVLLEDKPDEAETLPHPNQVPRPISTSRTAKRRAA